MRRAFFIEENPENIDENEIIAKYQGKFIEYSLKPSKNMPGFYLIKDSVANRDSTDLISDKIQKFIFSDCEKTFDELVLHHDETDQNLLKSLNSLISQKPHKNVFAIDESPKISSNLSKNCALSPIKPVAFCDEKKFQMKFNQKPAVKYQILAPNTQAKKQKEQVFCVNFPKILDIGVRKNLNADEKNIQISSQNDEICEINFGKSVKFDIQIVKSIFLLIEGYNENSDKFIFDTSKMPTRANYRYSIFKDRFEMKINAEISYQNAINLLKTFSYIAPKNSTKRVSLNINGKTIYSEQFGL